MGGLPRTTHPDSSLRGGHGEIPQAMKALFLAPAQRGSGVSPSLAILRAAMTGEFFRPGGIFTWMAFEMKRRIMPSGSVRNRRGGGPDTSGPRNLLMRCPGRNQQPHNRTRFPFCPRSLIPRKPSCVCQCQGGSHRGAFSAGNPPPARMRRREPGWRAAR